METAGDSKLLRFGVFEADLRTGELWKAGRKIGIQEQPFKVLVTLLARPGEMVSREELRDQVWSSDTFVDFDTGLNKAIGKIREVLGDSADSPRFIETLPRRGYRFIAPVETVRADAGAVSTRETAGAEPAPEEPTPVAVRASGAEPSGAVRRAVVRRRTLILAAVAAVVIAGLAGRIWWVRSHYPTFASIAVLPLENLTGDSNQEYFAEGITDELITELAKVGSLHVISRTSAMQYRGSRKPLPEIARELGVSAIVEGTVFRAGNRIRITAQLIDAATDQHLWAQGYERDLGDVLALQGQVAQDIAAHVNAKLTGSEQQRLSQKRPIRPEAYDDYLKGRFFWNRRSGKGAEEAIRYFERAIELEPDYAQAYAAIAEAYVVLGWDVGGMPPGEAFPKARAAALKALQIDGSSSEAHTSLMWIEFFREWNWEGAEKEAEEAIRLSPSDALAHHHYSRLLAFTGRFDEALAESRMSVQLDPLDPATGGSLAWNNYLARRYDEAIKQSLQMIEMYPSMPGFYRFLGLCYEAQGRFQDAIAAFQKARERSDSTWEIADLGYAYGISGDQQAARNALEQLVALSTEKYVPPYHIALVYVSLHQYDRAFEWLEKAFQEHSPYMVFLQTDPQLDRLRSDRRFGELMRRVGFPRAG